MLPSASSGREVIGFAGTDRALSMPDLGSVAEIVVIGTTRSDEVRPFTANQSVPASERDPVFYAKASYHDVTFDAIEYVKGTGARSISIRRLASTGTMKIASSEAPVLVPGRQYVLFLETGKSVWTGGYIVLGARGVGLLRGSAAVFEGTYGTVDIAELRRLVTTAGPPPKR
jgi:hypothetical protein